MKSRRKPNKTFAVTDVVVDYACFYFIGFKCQKVINHMCLHIGGLMTC